MTEPFKLFRLQQFDSQLDRARFRLKEIEAALSDDENLRKAEGHLQATSKELSVIRKRLLKAEQEVQDQRIKIEQTEATLYGGKIRNPKELQDLQKEAAALKRFKEVLEDRQLEAMIAVEEAEAAVKGSAESLENARLELDEKNARLTEEQSNLLKDVTRLETERQAAVGTISADDLNLYNQIRQQKRGVAVAKVSAGACSACGTTLNAALLSAARTATQITRCSSCGRILYGT
jgi:predicted  nucleic acid-binding Zn-ribbon protein